MPKKRQVHENLVKFYCRLPAETKQRLQEYADNRDETAARVLADLINLHIPDINGPSYTTCEYFNIYGEPRGRRGLNSGTCPPKCRVKKQPITKFNPNGNSWGKGCQKVHDNKRRRANEKGEEDKIILQVLEHEPDNQVDLEEWLKSHE